MGSSTSLFVLFLFWCFTSGLCLKYMVFVLTGSQETSSRVEIRLVGDGGRTSSHELHPRGGTFKSGSKNAFTFYDNNIGKITDVELKLLSGSPWSVKKVVVLKAGGLIYVFQYNKDVYSGKWTKVTQSCPRGFQVGSRGTCEDVNECKNNPCKGPIVKCQNTMGSYKCMCPRGYRVRYGQSCEDINECVLPTRRCDHECVNSQGSYRCKCRDGYKLVEGKCFDIDECTEGSHKCDPSTSKCFNYKGGYRCNCKPGHYRGESDTCKKAKCGAFLIDNGVASPPSCKDYPNYFGDVCTVKCIKGYELKDPKVNSMKCGDRQWVKPKPDCVAVKCPPLSPVANATLSPATCATDGSSYGKDCYYICNNDYKGSSKRTCQADKTWTSELKPFKCIKIVYQPVIHCPPDIKVDLAPAQKTADVSSKWKNPTYTGDTVTLTVSPSFASAKYRYPAGPTKITWTATNSAGSRSCSIMVRVYDKEPPKVLNCPKTFIGKLVTNTTSTKVTWTEPTFTDNVGVTKVISNYKSGDVFSIATYNVHYAAIDEAMNQATCSFRVIVKRKPCYELEGPRNGSKNCYRINHMPYCLVKCPAGRQIFGNPSGNQNFWRCLFSAWKPTKKVPDCVDATLSSNASTCTGLQVKMQIQTTSKIEVYCADCPTGTYSKTATCMPCPVGQYQDEQGRSSCKPCPVKATSSNSGAVDVKECRFMCAPGQFSPDGLNPGCKVCPKGTYQDQRKSTQCKNCPNGTSTISVASTQLSDCGVKPTISGLIAKPDTINERQDTTISCYASGVPIPMTRLTFSKKNIPAAFLGKMKWEFIKDSNGNKKGIKLTITGATFHNTGQYECKAENPFGKVLKEVTLTVKKVFGSQG